MSFFSKLFTRENKESLDKGLEKTKESFFGKITKAIAGKSTVDDDVLDNLEEVLITGDVGVSTTVKIIKRIQDRVKRDKYVSTSELNTLLRNEIASLLEENKSSGQLLAGHFSEPLPSSPYVIMVVGVNGVGKTTTIGKLAHQFKSAGKSVVLGAADTFRAAAVDQLVIWGDEWAFQWFSKEWEPIRLVWHLIHLAAQNQKGLMWLLLIQQGACIIKST